MDMARVYRMWTGPAMQLAPLAVLVFGVTLVVSCVWHARRGRMLRAVRWAAADALLITSVVVILRLTLPSTEPSTGLDPWTWMPFEDLIRAWPLDWARRIILDQMGANVLLFVPFGIALTLRGRRVPLWRVALVCAAFSGAIELTQGLAGNGRSADITDVLMNTLGGIGGWCVGRSFLVAYRVIADWWRARVSGGLA